MDYIPDLVSQYFQVLHQVQGEIDTQQVKDTIVMEVEKSVGQGLIKNELGNGCTVYTIDDAGMSLNIYDTDYGFWVTLVYNLD